MMVSLSAVDRVPGIQTGNHRETHRPLTFGVPAATVFAVLADPAAHAAIDGTGWVQEAADRAPLAEVGQVFRMDMYHPATRTVTTGRSTASPGRAGRTGAAGLRGPRLRRVP
jgi:hypothetical protein